MVSFALIRCILYPESVKCSDGFGIYSRHNELSPTSNVAVAHYSFIYCRLTMIFLKEMWMI